MGSNTTSILIVGPFLIPESFVLFGDMSEGSEALKNRKYRGPPNIILIRPSPI